MRKSIGIAIGAVLLTLASSPVAMAAAVAIDVKDDSGKALTGDPAAGAIVFHKCQVCHSTKPGENRVGPSLAGIIGRTSGSVPGFVYSTANKNSGIVWAEQKLFVYLKSPQSVVPGTKMTFPGLPKDQDRADIIAFLQETK
jgi:cytochrome c